jgi:hypothetical protein
LNLTVADSATQARDFFSEAAVFIIWLFILKRYEIHALKVVS